MSRSKQAPELQQAAHEKIEDVRKLVLDFHEARRRKMWVLRRKGYTYQAIADKLGFNAAAVYFALNPAKKKGRRLAPCVYQFPEPPRIRPISLAALQKRFEDFLSIKEAAALSGEAVQTWITRIHDGRITAYRFAGHSMRPRYFIDRRDLEEWLELNRLAKDPERGLGL